MGNSASQYEQYRRGTVGQGCIIFILAQVTYSSNHCYRIMSETNVFLDPAWACDAGCVYRSIMTEMGLNLADPIEARRVATDWRNQVGQMMVDSAEKWWVFQSFEASPADAWYRTDAEGVYNPKTSFLEFAIKQAHMGVGVHPVGFSSPPHQQLLDQVLT